ncbi:MAG TPA: ABC transporter substrate-binding protein [Chloroflexota bacterium]
MQLGTLSRRRFLVALIGTAATALSAACSAPPAPATPAGQAAGQTPSAGPTPPATTAAQPTTASGAGERAYYGVSGPFTGNNAEYGRIWKNAMEMAREEINTAGGVRGRPVELIYEDTQSDPKQSVAVAQKFVNDPRILAELGDFASPASMAASPIYQRAKMVQFGFTNSHPDFTKGGEFMFSIVLTQEQDAAFLAQTAVERLGKRQAVLYRNTDWGKVTHQIYVDKVKALGGEVVAVENYLETEKDFKPVLVKVRDANPEVVALISYYTDGALIMQQAQAVGLQAKVIANGACYSPQFLKLGGEAVEGVVMTTVFFPEDPRPDVQRFVQAYRERYNETPDQFAALAYDAVKIITWATEKGGFDRVAIQQAMATGTDIPSVIYGPFRFGPDRRVENAKAVPIQVKGGQFTVFA